MDLMPKKRSKVIILNKHTSMTQRQIPAECGVSLAAVNKIIRHNPELGRITSQQKGYCGRKC